MLGLFCCLCWVTISPQFDPSSNPFFWTAVCAVTSLNSGANLYSCSHAFPSLSLSIWKNLTHDTLVNETLFSFWHHLKTCIFQIVLDSA